MEPILKYLLRNVGTLKFQDFTASGTFTPSADLLAKGGVCLVILIGGGGGGSWRNSSNGGAFGGSAGTLRMEEVQVTEAITVTLGAGGLGATTNLSQGLVGGDSTFGALLTAAGGSGGFAPTTSYQGKGGRGALGEGYMYFFQEGSQTLDARGGVGWSGRAGGGGGTCAYGDSHMVAHDGGASGLLTIPGGGSITFLDAAANSGGGGAGWGGSTGRAGNGGSGWCRVIWVE
jgi:hypothetical protein